MLTLAPKFGKVIAGPEMNISLAILLVSCKLVTWSYQPPAVPNELITTEQMREYLELRESALAPLTVRFETVEYFGRGASEPPTNAESSEYFVSKEIGSFAALGRRYRLEMFVEDASEPIANMIGRQVIQTFDGVEARRRLLNPNFPENRQHQGQIGDSTFKSVVTADFQSWYGWWVLQRCARLSYLDLFSRDDLEGPTLLPDGRTQWRVTMPGDDLSGVVLTARRDGERVELAEVLYQGYRNKLWGNKSDVNVAIHVAFGPTDVRKDEVLASDAVVTGMHYRTKPEDEFWGLARITLHSVEPRVERDDTFRVSFDPTADVTDNRYRISYRLGDTALVVDGRLLRTSEPLTGDVGDNLEWWVANGEWGPTPKAPPGELDLDSDDEATDEAPTETRSPWATAFFVVLVILGILVLRAKRGGP